MDTLVTAYVLYLVASLALTVVVARTLSRHGETFLTSVFPDNDQLAVAINRLLVVGFYLVSLGFVALWLSTDGVVRNVRDVFEMLSLKLGTVALVLGLMHLVNVLVFSKIRGQRIDENVGVPAESPETGSTGQQQAEPTASRL